MLSTNTNFDVKHALDYKTPMYLVHFDGSTKDYCDHKPGSPNNVLAQCLVNITGRAHQITPEEGRASIGGMVVEILDHTESNITFQGEPVTFGGDSVIWTEDELTALISTDTYNFHRKKTTIKAGYAGMDEADMLTVMTGWISDLKMSSDLTSYLFSVTDPQQWMLRKIFRGSESVPVTLSGNPLDILLAVLTSTGLGTNGTYDTLAADNALGIDDDYIDVAGIESVRDDYYPGTSNYMEFTITERISAKSWFETEIFKPLVLYPTVDGQGRFGVKPFKPPLPTVEIMTIDQDSIEGVPAWDANLNAMVNEVEAQYDWNATTKEFDTRTFWVDTDSVDNRGPGKKQIVVKSKGIITAQYGATMMTTRKTRIFARWATPPAKITFSAFFSKWLAEAGDMVYFSHPLLPNFSTGAKGIISSRMEVINRSIDWRKGRVKFELLTTGFANATYQVISPTMTVTAGTDGENFTVSVADAAKYADFTLPEFQLCNSRIRQLVAAKTLLTVNTTTGACTCDALGVTPAAGDFILFADYDSCTAEQKAYGFIADASNYLGAANDAAYRIG